MSNFASVNLKKKLKTALFGIALTVVLSGCIDRAKDDQVLQRIGHLELVNSTNIVFLKTGGGLTCGTAMPLATVEVIGELVSSNSSPLPKGFANQISDRIRDELIKQGCIITGGGSGGGIHYTPASGIRTADTEIERSSIYFSLNGSAANAEILVIGRDYPSVTLKGRVVGQLVVLLNESR